jgi:hypothetical protein
MTDELTNPNAARVDGFDDDSAEDDFVRVIQGEKWAFTNEGTWMNADEKLISPDREVVVVDVKRVLQKWLDQMPVQGTTSFLGAGDQVDVDALNEECPKEEWSEDLNGRPRGPWQIQHVVYMVDLQTMEKFTYPTSTVAGGICVGELKDAVRLMRRFKGPGVYPVISPAAKHMNTRFGGRQRPHFKIKRWISFGPDGMAALPPASPAPSLQAATVKEPTLREEMGDDRIPF